MFIPLKVFPLSGLFVISCYGMSHQSPGWLESKLKQHCKQSKAEVEAARIALDNQVIPEQYALIRHELMRATARYAQYCQMLILCQEGALFKADREHLKY